jgi:hypothetical protein
MTQNLINFLLIGIIAGVLFLFGYEMKTEKDIQIEAIKAGLVQTVIDGKVLWVKPSQP